LIVHFWGDYHLSTCSNQTACSLYSFPIEFHGDNTNALINPSNKRFTPIPSGPFLGNSNTRSQWVLSKTASHFTGLLVLETFVCSLIFPVYGGTGGLLRGMETRGNFIETIHPHSAVHLSARSPSSPPGGCRRNAARGCHRW